MKAGRLERVGRGKTGVRRGLGGMEVINRDLEVQVMGFQTVETFYLS